MGIGKSIFFVNGFKFADIWHSKKSIVVSDLKEGEDFYFERGLMVLTAKYLLKRGYCCKNACRNCPYGFTKKKQAAQDAAQNKDNQE
jgi:hypothetical protein